MWKSVWPEWKVGDTLAAPYQEMLMYEIIFVKKPIYENKQEGLPNFKYLT